MSNKSNKSTIESTEQPVVVDHKTEVHKYDTLMAKVRYLLSAGFDVKGIYAFFKANDIKNGKGGEVKYQHVRNYTMQILGKQAIASAAKS